MVVLEFSKNGLTALICENILRIYNINDQKLVFKHSFGEGKTSKSEETNDSTQLPNTTFCYGCAFSKSGKFLAAFSQKELLVFKTCDTEEDWEQVGKRKITKRPTAVLITHSEEQVIISDKSGDVYRYSISDGLSDETILLGHVSMVLDMAISSNDQYLLTSDRDEKIRVSCYPNSYNIQSFCLGHTEYVMKILLLETSPEILVSASGDGSIRFWQFKTGKLIHTELIQNTSSDQSTPVISCLTCSRNDSLVFVGTKGSSMVHVYQKTDEKQVKTVSGIMLDAPPHALSVDYGNRLWVVQSNKQQTIIIFKINCDDGKYEFTKVTDCTLLRLLSVEGWDIIYESLKDMPHFEQLSKKEGYGTIDYFKRKTDRIEATKRKKDVLVQSASTADKEVCSSEIKKLKA